MRIQHNILAMNAYRNYNNNTAALGKNLEKLSSGYKINRAGDDAAGLAISEKMRAQITGLNAASKNVKDGISLVKTAEGAMQEIQDMLNRMDYLATQSANGTYDNEVDRANLQKEVDALKTEINRIADSANFNGIKLLDGSLDKGAVSGVSYDKKSADDIKKMLPGSWAGIKQEEVDEDNIGKVGILETDTATPATDASFEISLDGIGTVTVGDGESFTLKIGGQDAITLSEAGSYDGAKLAQLLAESAADGGVTVGADTYTVTADNTTLKFTCADATAPLNTAAAVTWSVTGATEGESLVSPHVVEDGDDTSTAPEVTDPTSKAIDFTDGADDSAGQAETYSYDLAGLAYDIPEGGTTLTFNVAGKDYDVAVAKGDAAAAIAGKLVTAINKDQPTDETVGAYTAAVDKTTNTKITLTAEKKGVVDSTLSQAISVKNKDVSTMLGNNSSVTVGTTTAAGESATGTYTLDLSGLGTAAAAGKLKISVGGNDYTVSYAANDTASDIADKFVTEYDKNKVTDTGTGDFTAANSEGTITFTAENAAAFSDTDLFNGTNATITDASLTTDITNKAISKDKTGAASNGSAATANFDLAGMSVDKAGKVEFAFGDKKYTVDVAEDDNAAAIATKLVDEMNKDPITDEDAGAFTAKVDTTTTTKIVLTAAKESAVNADLPTTFTVTGKSDDDDDNDNDNDNEAPNVGGVEFGSDEGQIGTDGDANLENALNKLDGSSSAETAITAGEVAALKTTFPTAGGGTTISVTVTGDDLPEGGESLNVDLGSAIASLDTTGSTVGDLVTALRTAGEDAITQWENNPANADKEYTFELDWIATDPDGENKLYDSSAVSQESLSGQVKGLYYKFKLAEKQDNEQPTSAAGKEGTINTGIQNPVDKSAGTRAQLAHAAVDFTKADANVWEADGSKITIGDTTYTVAYGKDSKFKNAKNVIDLTQADGLSGAALKRAGAQALSVAAKDNSIFTVGHDGKGNTTLQQKTSAKESTDMTTADKFASYLGVSVADATSVRNAAPGKGLTLQIGDTSDSYNQMSVAVGDMHTSGMGIADIDISTQEGAAAAVQTIKNAINYVSSVRGDLGATQNRLEHTANNLSVMSENIQDAESTIRDTDVAEEMMSYVKNNILVQSAQAMLAQANQVPQGVLQLLG